MVEGGVCVFGLVLKVFVLRLEKVFSKVCDFKIYRF